MIYLQHLISSDSAVQRIKHLTRFVQNKANYREKQSHCEDGLGRSREVAVVPLPQPFPLPSSAVGLQSPHRSRVSRRPVEGMEAPTRSRATRAGDAKG
jgi:hypothetical protein